MRAALQRAWLHRGPLARALFPFSLLYAALTRVHRWLFRTGLFATQRLPVPVVVIGNVVAGGAGKTPVVIAIVEHLLARGLRPGVVSRGYGRDSRGCIEVTDDSDARAVGDEPLLVARRCGIPVVVCADRPEAARLLLARHPGVQVILSDDGLQHLALERDVEVVVFDDRGAGNRWLLPAGPLRESWPRPSNLVVKTAAAPGIGGFLVERRLGTLACDGRGTRKQLSQFADTPCVALAGIARPEAFFRMLRDAGLTLSLARSLPDHHDFATPLASLPAGQPVLCTEKDAVKLWRTMPQAWAVPLDVGIEAAFWSALDALLEPKLSSAHGSQAA